ncbi:MAG: hypothetical protein EXR24_06615 [Ignavibacteria bacterium]|nr:hypothetical protein [Bacteroidota bacterium]MSQ46631.1 hypothetical protein [Ignavibacteria bacterium]
MSNKTYFLFLAIITCSIFVFGYYIIDRQNNADLLPGLIIGCLINLVGILISFLMKRKASTSSSINFGNLILGSMVIRIGFLASSMLIAILFFKINRISLAISTISFYLAYLILELFYIGKNSTNGK